jgi:hypothetical protein
MRCVEPKGEERQTAGTVFAKSHPGGRRFESGAVRPQPRQEGAMMAFHYRLEHQDGTPADPATLHSAIPTLGRDMIPLRPGRTLRVIGGAPGKGPTY